ncbi:multiple monosaccharide ABC transporter substrate-binding protein [Streptomyces sp. NPDC088354]|uniref:multiple monosaccharide ABC transporter substrate-binding protein n=1 Tax=unclassified Streptomyces TaxID=2593676 RepID=UPI0029AB7CCC|nr:multiple monosaccharide ABC transporter substrate-binding protein [Streptomyces sp. MI02-7b]MDX3071395.1 sugar ABC transporter substrate-binding protein [Streptomyces sp. MI02-7b]
MHAGRAARLRTAIFVVLTLTASTAAAGCGGQSGSDGGAVRVGIALPTRAQTRWIADGQNMVKQFKAKGYETDLQFAGDNVDTQVDQVQKMIDEGDKVLVIGAVDGFELGEVLQQAHRAGIKVIAYDRLLLGTSNVDYYASFNNDKVGQLQADYIVDKLGLKQHPDSTFTLEIFAGDTDDNNAQFFFNGAMNVLQPYIKSGRLVIKSGQSRLSQVATLKWDAAIATETMTTRLKNYYRSATVDAVLAPNDGIARGVIDALKKDGYGKDGKPMPVITGQDAEVDSVKEIIKGDQSMTVYKDTRKLAARAVEMAGAVLSGAKPEINNDTDYDNGNKVVPAYLLTPVSVDKGNYKKLLVDSGYIKTSDLK